MQSVEAEALAFVNTLTRDAHFTEYPYHVRWASILQRVPKMRGRSPMSDLSDVYAAYTFETATDAEVIALYDLALLRSAYMTWRFSQGIVDRRHIFEMYLLEAHYQVMRLEHWVTLRDLKRPYRLPSWCH